MKPLLFASAEEIARGTCIRGDNALDLSRFEVVAVSQEDSDLIEKLQPLVHKARIKALRGKKSGSKLLGEVEHAQWLAQEARCADEHGPFSQMCLQSLEERGELRRALAGCSSLEFFNLVSNGLVKGDPEFFREVAELIQAVNEGPADLLTLCLCNAYLGLLPELRRLPTKHEVKDRAVKLNALHNFLVKRGESRVGLCLSRLNRLSLDEQKQVNKDAKSLLKRFEKNAQTNLYRKAGLTDLKQATGGQPFHKKRDSTMPN